MELFRAPRSCQRWLRPSSSSVRELWSTWQGGRAREASTQAGSTKAQACAEGWSHPIRDFTAARAAAQVKVALVAKICEMAKMRNRTDLTAHLQNR